MRLVTGWIAASGALLACAGCGFKGPLYLPERNATVITHPAPAAQSAPGATPRTQPGQPQAPGNRKKAESPPPPPSPAAAPPAAIRP
jgi:predicted small lipoprotein YifL